MTLLITVWDLFRRDFTSILITFIVIYLVIYITRFYWKVYQLPPGPFPFPIIGNILNFIGCHDHFMHEIGKIGDKYGQVFTVWFAWNPIVFITDVDIGREAFSKREISGKTSSPVENFIGVDMNEGKFGVTCPIGPEWGIMRRFFHHAIQKFQSSDHLSDMVNDCVDNTVKLMVEKEGTDKPFVCSKYLNNMMLNTYTRMFFSKKFEMKDPIIKEINEASDVANLRIVLWELSPGFRSVDKKYERLKEKNTILFELLRNQFLSHYSDYDPMITRDFSDALITAKNEEISKGKQSVDYFTDYNLVLSLTDIVDGATMASHLLFEWTLLYMLLLPEMCHKLKEEIESQIGNRIPTLEDRNRCHYTMAFLTEVIRLRNTEGPGLYHITTAPCKLGEFNIPVGTGINLYFHQVTRNEKYWPMSQQFRPERFLHNGKYVTIKPKAFVRFGVGGRQCLGDKIVTNMWFLCLVRFIQKTADYELVLHSSADLKPNPKVLSYSPKEFKIILKSKKHLKQ